MEILITGCWAIWNQRNDEIFEDTRCSLLQCRINFTRNFKDTMIKARPSIKEGEGVLD